LDGIVSVSKRFLRGYYNGEPNPAEFHGGILDLEPGLSKLYGDVYYRPKRRNIDRNEIYPSDILEFVQTFLTNAIDRKIGIPDHVVGCACGASEVAMVLADALGVGVDFIRLSKRRNDKDVKIIKEQKDGIVERVRSGSVVCVEDFVCTSLSLAKVMRKVTEFGVPSVLGASIKYSREGDHARNIASQRDFHLFELGEPQ
jgi:hypothetical protein